MGWLKRLVVLVALAIAVAPAQAQAPRRVALVIANTNYQGYAPLPNTATDAGLVRAALAGAGFQTVDVRTDLGIAQVRTALADFKLKADGADVALVYFAGHGIEVNGRNWLIPVDAALSADSDLDFQAIDANLLLTAAAGARARIVVLDACRENPFAGRMRRLGALSRAIAAPGLAAPVGESTRGSLLMYSAAPGELAADGAAGQGSPFARAFARYIGERGTELRVTAGKISDAVFEETGHAQLPFTSSSLSGVPIVLVGSPGVSGATDPRVEAEYWKTCCSRRNADASDFQGYLQQVEAGRMSGAFADIARRRLGALTPASAAAPAPETTAPRAPPASFAPAAAMKECADCPDLVGVVGGAFMMGAAPGEPGARGDESPQHNETVPSLWVGRTEVTFAQWDACVSDGGCDRPLDQGWGRGTLPVIDVSWAAAQDYVKWLSAKTGATYRLPTEAEWEHAARGGATTPYSYGADVAKVCEYGNVRDRDSHVEALGDAAACADKFAHTAPAASFKPNRLGLFDTIGNVWEWTADCYRGDLRAPVQSADCAEHAMRGGSYLTGAVDARSAARSSFPTASSSTSIGLRVVREP